MTVINKQTMKKVKKIFFLTTISGSFLFASAVSADFLPEEWLHAKEIQLPAGITEDTLVGVELDNEVFANAKADFSDLRIVDKKGTEIPYVLRSETTQRGVVDYSPRMLNLSNVPRSYTSFVADFGGNVAHNQIKILTNSKNFRRKVTISGSNDQKTWQIIKEGDEIYDYSLEFNARDVEITYLESVYKYLLVRIEDGDEEPLSIQGVSAKRVETRRAKKVLYTPSVTKKEDGKQTVITLDLGQRGLETDTATFSISSQNFERYISISGSDNNKDWYNIGSDVLYSYQTSKVYSSKSTIRYGSVNKRFLRMTINNYDNQPLVIENSVRLEGLARSVLFLADADVSYGLYYGYTKGNHPRYDFDKVYERFDEDEIVRGSLDVQRDSSWYIPPKPLDPPPEPVVPWTEKVPWLLPLVYALAGGFLVFIMTNIYRKTTPRSGAQKIEN